MLADLPPHVVDYYAMLKELPDGRICGVQRLLFHWTLHVDIDDIGYADRYCYQTEEGALRALIQWDGEGDPEGWHRHPKSGRRRDLATGKEWIAP
jgi:hypothetical protein